MTPTIRVLVVEDEPLTRRALTLALAAAGFEVAEAGDAAACRAILRERPTDVVVLDLGLPDQDGIDLAADMRKQGDVGLIVVTRRASPDSRIEALDVGADDYLVKPVHFGELAARIRSVMRRRKAPGRQTLRIGRWIVDLDARSVLDGAATAGLTRGEFDILARLIAANGGIVSREELLTTISRRPHDADLRSVDVLVSRIRRKLSRACDNDPITTAPGFGYQLNALSRES